MVQQIDAVADALVIGGGIAGMIAANRLAELGQKTIVLEQGSDTAYLCNSRYTGGCIHVCFRNPVARRPEELLQEIHAKSGAAVPELAGALAEDTRRVIAWLREQGVRFVKAGAEEYQSWTLSPPRNNTYGLVWQGRGGDMMLRTLGQVLLSRGGVLRRGVRATGLDLSNPEGVVLQALEGDQKRQFQAKAVVIADGGFQADPDLVRQFISPRPEALFQRGAATGRGDGLRMAMQAGAKYVGENRFYGHVLAKDAFHNDGLWPFPVLDPLAMAGIVVDGSAQRFVDEGKGGVWIANNIAWLPDPLSAVVIFDEAIWRGPAAAGWIAPNPHMLSGGGRIQSAATIPELASALGLPPEALLRTVEEYNAAFSGQRLDRLAPARSSAPGKPMPILHPPYHAVPLCAGITYTMGGIAIDEHARALDHAGRPIKGLYAAGCSTGGIEGGQLGDGYTGGLSKSGVTALRAAEHIARGPN